MRGIIRLSPRGTSARVPSAACPTGMYSMALMTRTGTRSTRALAVPVLLSAFVFLALLVLAGGGVASAQESERNRLALELARILIDDRTRQDLSDQVGLGLLQLIGVRLEDRLNRRLQEGEVRTLASMIRGFMVRTLTEERIEDIGARVYARHFDAAELKAMVDFQRSDVARKAARLSAVLAQETARGIDAEIAQSAALPRLIEELGQEFPVLRVPETP